MATATIPRPTPAAAQPRPRLAGRRDRARPTRRVGPAGRVVVVGGICLAVWAVLAAPALRSAAETSPLGLRRTAALAILRPLARVSALFGLDRPQHGMEVALGRRSKPALPETFPRHRPRLVPSPRPLGSSAPGATRPGATAEPKPSTTPSVRESPRVPATTGPVLPRPTKDDRLRVLVVGDSIAIDLGIGLVRLLDGSRFVTAVDARVSTGLARPDYFDWPAQTSLELTRFRPDVVVAMFGANDDQGFLLADHGVAFGSSEWRTLYARRVSRMMQLVTDSGRPLVWVGMPTMRSGGFAASMRTMNAIYRTQAARRPGVVYVDSWPVFSSPNGRYTAYLPNSSGQEELVRAPDGVHLTAAGDERLAREVIEVLEGLWKPSQAPAPAPLASTSSRVELTPSAPGPDGHLVT